ncbi:unnamed protein product [Plutella xylostella]|uniref:(diamondback moth) hypothetical protein n=1 Tax=Plutella xylostella TaxID=51655 RepID=A0A8S4GEA4_PLUXY|nr:unnamed protein product [Plutella xylostella]
MADNYDSNNGFNSGDFKRNSNQDQHDKMEQDGEDTAKLNEKAGEYMRELLSEKIKIDQTKFPMSTKLIDQEVTRVQTSGRIPSKDFKYVDVFREKPVKVAVKVLVPIKEHPKFNFVGKLLGPKGNTMKQLQEETMCKMAVLGRGSMRDRRQEQELRNSLDPKYAHLSDELHVEISALAPPAEAHARIAYALAEIKKFLVPDPPEMMGGRPPMMRDMPERPPGKWMHAGGPRGPPRMPPGPPPARPPPSRAPPKSKVFSILDRARSAMETYPGGYDDPYGAVEPPPVRGPPPRPSHEQDYYGYERERYYEDDTAYYKDEGPREYKASSRDVGTRRAPPQPRHFARASPYSRPPKVGGPPQGGKKPAHRGQH